MNQSDNPSKLSWKELIAARDKQEQIDREIQLQKGREAWAKIKEEVMKQDTEGVRTSGTTKDET